MKKKFFIFSILVVFMFNLLGCGIFNLDRSETLVPTEIIEIQEDERYTSAEDVALYIFTFDKLPTNYLTKQEAIALGWQSEKGNLWDVSDQMSIGGDRFGNREKLLPNAEGRIWFECDVDYQGGYRNAKRLVYSNDGLIYYTDDHYESFTELTFVKE
jgi:hypothetical protein